MSKRIMAVGNGDELHEAINGRVYRHVYDERSGRYVTLSEDFDGSPWANCRRERITVAALVSALVAAPLAAITAQNKAAGLAAELADIDATQAAAANRWGY